MTGTPSNEVVPKKVNSKITETTPKSCSSPKRGLGRKRLEESNDPRLDNVVHVTQNPFENTPVLNFYEVSKRIFVGVTIFPFRCVIFIGVVLILWILSRLTMLNFPLVPDRGCYMHKEPLPMWRYILATPITILFRILLWCMGFLWISVVDYRRDYRVAEPNIVVIGPHVTMFDMFVMMCVYPRSGFLGQHHVVNIPILNSIGTVTQGIFIDIADKDSKHSCKEGIASRASCGWKGGRLLIFPEGTITNGKQLVQFKAGAFTPGEPVQPVILRYPWSNYDISWVGKNRSFGWGFRCALQFVNWCEVDILPTYQPSQEEKNNPILYANNVRDTMARWENPVLPTTEHTYDDVFFYRDAVEAGVGNDFLVKDLKKKFNMNADELKEMLNTFREADTDGSGHLSCQEIMDLLQIEATDKKLKLAIRRIFDLFDTDHSGVIEYREFVQINALLWGRSSGKDLAMLAFTLASVNEGEDVDTTVLKEQMNKLFRQRNIGANLFEDFERERISFSEFCGLVHLKQELLRQFSAGRASEAPGALKEELKEVIESMSEPRDATPEVQCEDTVIPVELYGDAISAKVRVSSLITRARNICQVQCEDTVIPVELYGDAISAKVRVSSLITATGKNSKSLLGIFGMYS